MKGCIEPDTERDVRALVDLRDRIVHGDLLAEPSAGDIESVLTVVEETMRANTPATDADG